MGWKPKEKQLTPEEAIEAANDASREHPMRVIVVSTDTEIDSGRSGRGARLDESAPGTGLGLAIVDDLSRAYGGDLRLGVSERGGLKVEIDLPRADN